MKQRILTLLLLLTVVFGVHAQLLWKVSGNGLAKPSYIMGTYHMARTSFVDSIPGVKQALDSAEQVYGELDMLSLASDPAAGAIVQHMMLPKEESLDHLLTADQMKRLNAFLTETLGADFSNPAVAPLKQMKPAALSTQLQVMLCMRLDPTFNPNDQFDTYFQKEAQKQQKKVGGLETMQEQMDILFNHQSLQRQAELLMCLVDHTDYQTDLLRRTIQAYYAQDLAAIQQLTEEKEQNSCDSTPEEEAALLYTRNARWAEALPAIMNGASTFVAVGAAHLPGTKGLLQLLKQKGYEVTAVK